MAYFSLYKPLVIYDTEENIVEKRSFVELHDLTRSVLQILHEALGKRYFFDIIQNYLLWIQKVFTLLEIKKLMASEFKFSYLIDLCLLLRPMTRSGGRFDIMIGCHNESLRKMLSRLSKRESERIKKLHKKRIIDLF